MTAHEIITEMYQHNFPNLAYKYLSDDGVYHVVILGANSCPVKKNIENLLSVVHVTTEMLEIYKKDTLTDSDKYMLGKRMHTLQRMCDSRKEGLHTKEEQEKYLSSLTPEQLDEIVEQIEMFKASRLFYRNYVYNS